MRENQPADKSLAFSLRIVNLNQSLVKSKQETILSKQMFRSGAGISEANYSQTKTDFVMKLHAALKATAETEYRIRLLRLSEYIDRKMCESMLWTDRPAATIPPSTLHSSFFPRVSKAKQRPLR